MEQKSNGALISSIIIVILLIVGGIFFWKTNIKNKASQPTGTTPTTVDTTGTTNEVSSIDDSLKGIDINNLDQGL